MIQDTSYDAFLRTRPKISKSQMAVLKVIRDHKEGLTDAEINHYLGWTINRVTPRRGELMDRQDGDNQNAIRLGLIYDDGRRQCRVTHSQAHAYKAKDPVLPPAHDPELAPKPDGNTRTELFA